MAELLDEQRREQDKINTYQALKLLADAHDVVITEMDWDAGVLNFNGADDNLREFAVAITNHPILRDLCE